MDRTVIDGMTLEQYAEVVAFVQKHHKFGWVDAEDRLSDGLWFHIKYVISSYDSRDEKVWSVVFRGFGARCFATNLFLDIPYTNLFDWVMAYLKGEWKPTNEQKEELRFTE